MDTVGKKEYEVAFVVKNESAIPEILKLLKVTGGEIGLEGPVRRISLAYEIQNSREGYMSYVHCRLPPEKPAELEKNLKMNPAVMRSFILEKPFIKSVEAPPARPRVEMRSREPAVSKPPLPISNEELERKIDEILQ